MKTTLTVIANNRFVQLSLIKQHLVVCQYIYFDSIDSLDTNLDTIVRGFRQVKPNLYNDIDVGLSTYFYVIYEFTPEAYDEFKKYIKELTKTDFDEFEFSKNRLVKLLKYEFPKESRSMVNYIQYGITDDDIDDLFNIEI